MTPAVAQPPPTNTTPAHTASGQHDADSTTGHARFSLRGRLLWLLLSAIAGLWLLIALAVFVRAHDVADELFDAQMRQMASSLLDTSAAGPDALPTSLEAVAAGRAPALVFQLWRRNVTTDGRHEEAPTLLVHSKAAPHTPLIDGEGFREQQWGGELWRFYSLRDASGRYEAQIGQQHDVRYALARAAAGRMLIPLLAGLPLLALAIWLAIGHALRPLSVLATAVSARRPDQLDPIPVSAPPAEVSPLIDALNGLFERIHRTLDNERQFTANAAHELRTPLAALKTQAQVALRAESEGERRESPVPERRHALEQVIAGVDRMTRLTEQLLLLARLDPEHTALARQHVDLAAIAVDVCALLDAKARTHAVELAFVTDSDAAPHAPHGASIFIEGVGDLLAALLRNLIENAIQHARVGGTVDVSLRQDGNTIELDVDDDGPGIPEAQRAQALERFERLGERGGGGSGLGLSIAARIVALHGGQLDLAESPAGGLRARVRLPVRHGTASPLR
ncbi:HAMP domain-containing protein [Rhodocyclus tenuis]|uniref:ATP-binding protein n=1 Tax=Rhodocyclus gracilis TaxID=2929842 RepID=UPI0012988A13|nr:ATP-binding protein [Rhodocyclus gracilis]MRD72601.1 HAMP domain-containing protein [Rhodocyclus gracilis]